ncbi:conserved membrane hypothetical protein [uncultured Dysgonomonas sp.]|uniref:Sulfatase N-terminal domain-containing protein n=2 Tax=uncultured Dysgonomonas sp. TaxID=206096 RepID=A0A212K2K1_9BACT|nr:conserved membrane hypothetical protein [uncultured Dysgonomonas sp.]
MLDRIKNKLNSQFIGVLVYLLSIHMLFLALFSLFRFISFIQNKVYLESVDDSLRTTYTLAIFTKGLRFDNVITCYIMVLPLVILTVLALFNRFNKGVLRIVNAYFIIVGIIVFAISSADIPYLQYFNKHIGFSVFNWLGYSVETYGMIVDDNSLFAYLLLYLFVVVFFIFFVIKIRQYVLRRFKGNVDKRDLKFYIPILFCFLCICLLGTRGLIHKRLVLADSYFCNQLMLCQMVVNPVFYLLNTPVSAQAVSLENEYDSLELINEELGFNIVDRNYYEKGVMTSDTLKQPNIVMVLIESFSSDYLNDSIGAKPLMPYVNELKNKSYYFDNIYSQGTHTNQGIVSSLYGFPAIFDVVMSMKAPIELNHVSYEDEKYNNTRKAVPLYHGLPNDLKRYGYQNLFFVTNSLAFDNLDYFLPLNGFDECFGVKDYPSSEQVGIWGVSDKYLFDFSLSKMDSVCQEGISFYANILTISNHPPYALPGEFLKNGIPEDQAAMSYSDYCIMEFMDEISKKDWYNNTIFVFLGDHGKVKEQKYDIPLSLTHIPLIIYSPLFENEARTVSDLGGQIDVYATLMGLIDKAPAYNTFGIDLLKDRRPYIYFTSDDKLGCLGNDYYYISDLSSGRELLYELSDNSISNKIEQNRSLADSMRRYSGSMIEGAKHIFKNYLK